MQILRPTWPVSHLRWQISLNVLIFLGYLFLFSIGNKLSINDRYSLFNPAAGLALAAAIRYSNTALYAIGMASVVCQMLWPQTIDTLDSGIFGVLLTSLCVVLAVKIGAKVSNPNHLPEWEPVNSDLVIRFILFGCFASSLVILLPQLLKLLFSTSTQPDLLTQMVVIWGANSSGAICLAPVFLKVFKAKRTELLLLPWKGILSPMIVALIGLYLFQQQYIASSDLVRSRDQGFLEDVAIQLKNKTENQEQVVLSTIALRRASSYVSPDEFNQFTHPLLKQNPEIRALEWAPIVKLEDRAEFVSKVQSETGVANFEIKQLSPNGSLIVAGDRDSYAPVTYLNPTVGNENAHGLDLMSNEVRKKTLEKAVRSQRATLTPPIHLVQDAGKDGIGSLMIIPSFNEQRKLEGFAVGVYDVKALLSTVLNNQNNREWSFEISDTTLPGMSTRLASFGNLMCNQNDYSINPVSINIMGRRLSLSGCREDSIFTDTRFNLIQIFGFIAAIASSQVLFLTMTNEENDAKYKAMHDELTKLLNRRGFNERIKELELSNKHKSKISTHSLLFIDLDGFKTINDHMGHEMGDKILEMVATAIKQTIRESDIAARFGGDEFCVLFTQCNADNCIVLAQKLMDRINELNKHLDHPQSRISASMGVSEIYSTNPNGLQEALSRADKACYISKGQDGNTISTFGS